MGFIAYGGLACGFYSMGGAAFGWHALGGNHKKDPEAFHFFRTWAGPSLTYITLGLILIASVVPGLVTSTLRRRLMRESQAPSGTQPESKSPR
jgi:hypothetical protein